MDPATIDFTCDCGNRMQIPSSMAGKSGQCQRCGMRFTMPSSVNMGPMVDITTDRYAQAAKASWIAPIIGVIFAMATQSSIQSTRMVRLATGGACFIIYVAGVAFGVFALSGIRKRGSYGILPQAYIGLAINGLILASNVIMLVYSLARR